MTGRPVTEATDSAAPPRASPSSLVSTTPSKPTPSRNAWAVATASWPIIASTTNSTSSGSTASRMSDGLLHHLGVDAEPAGGVDDDDVVQGPLGLLDRGPRDRDRVADAVAGLGREDRYADALAVDLELVDRVGPLQVAGDQQRALALLLEPERELGGERRLAGALETGEQDDRRAASWRSAAGGSRRRGSSTSSSLTILTICWAGFSAWLTSSPRARSLTAADELLDHRQRDVGLEQRDPDLARGGVDVGLGEPTLAAQVLEGVGETVGEGGEHGRSA